MRFAERLRGWRADLVVAAVLTIALAGPLLVSRGYWLHGDMVFTPRQPWKAAWLGLDGTFPRSVPIDAVTSLLTHLFPGWLVQRLLLIGPMLAGGVGAGRLAGQQPRLATRTTKTGESTCPWYARAAGITLFCWNPWTAERLLLGQWAILAGYLLLPWVVVAVRSGSRAAMVVAVFGCAGFGPPSGIMAAVLALCVAVVAKPRKATVAVAGLGVLANLPWLVPALFVRSAMSTDAATFEAFRPRAESGLGVVASLISLGGTWKVSIVPESRHSAIVVALSVAVTLMAVAGLAAQVRRDRRLRGVALAGVLGLTVALYAAVPAGARSLGHLAGQVGPVALARDAQRWLAWYAVLLVPGYAAAVAWVGRRAGRGREALRGVVGLLVITPVLLLPSLAWGALGALRPASYPSDWERVAGLIGDAPGATVVLPWTGSYRGYAWNRHHAVLDPAQRYFPGDVLVDDRLIVGRTVVGGEDPRLARVGRALAAPDPGVRRQRLRSLGVRWVLVEAGNGVRRRDLPAGTPRYRGRVLTLLDLGSSTGRPAPGLPRAQAVLVVVADLVWLGVLGGAVASVFHRRRDTR